MIASRPIAPHTPRRVAGVPVHRRRGGGAGLALVAIVLCAAPRAARAQEGGVKPGASSEPSTDADQLFRDAKKLIEEKRYEEACPKLVESQRLDPAGGTALTLALCHQAQGKLATAIGDFETALVFAERDRRADRVKVARDAIASLTPAVSKLTVRLDPRTAALDGVQVELDGVTLAAADFDVARPIDGGKHEVVARAKGHQGIILQFPVRPRDETPILTVPWLPPLAPAGDKPAPAPAPVAPAPTKVEAPPAPAVRTVRTALTIGAFGVALAGGVVATAFAVSAKSADADADDLCQASPCSDPDGVALNEDARDKAWIATAATGVALAGAITGAVLLLTWPRDGVARTSTGQRRLQLSAGARGVALRGAF